MSDNPYFKKPDTPALDKLDLAERERLVDEVKRGISRREAITLMAASGVTAAMAGQLFTEAGEVAAATPKKGGTIRYATNLHGPNDQSDPPQFTSNIDYARGRTIYNSLIQHAEDLSPQPELATSFEPNSNATEWTFKLRKDVEFHDGSKFSADDVVYSMNRHLAEDSTSVIKSVMSSVKEWKKVGSHEVKAVMNTPNSDLPTLLGVFQNKIVKNGTKGEWIGTGPFTMETFEPGVKSISLRNENYWRKPANVDAIEITAITDPVARVNALIAGDVHDLDQPRSQVLPAGRIRRFGVTLHVDTRPRYSSAFCCLKNTEPGSNDDFVKGMQYIQDRERIVKRILKGKGSIGNDTPISSAHGADFCAELPQREYDPDKAKFHFEKSGYDRCRALCCAGGLGARGHLCLLAQANCAKIGFDLQLKKSADRRLLGCGLDEGTDQRGYLEHAADREFANGDTVRSRCRVERHLLEQ